MAPIKELGAGRGRAYGNPVPPYNQVLLWPRLCPLTWGAERRPATRKLREHGVVDSDVDLFAILIWQCVQILQAAVLVWNVKAGSGRK